MTDTRTIPTLRLGDRVIRTQGRPTNIGHEGVITLICDDVVGSAGDILVIVMEDDGTVFTCYDRQLSLA